MSTSDPDQYSVLFDTWLVGHLLGRRLDEVLAPSGLSGDDFALYHLVALNGPITPGEICQWTGMRPSTVTSYIRRMTQRGHGRKRPSSTDGRSYRIELSSPGKKVYAKAMALFWPGLVTIHAELGDDVGDIRIGIQYLDDALRRLNHVAARPYTL